MDNIVCPEMIKMPINVVTDSCLFRFCMKEGEIIDDSF